MYDKKNKKLFDYIKAASKMPHYESTIWGPKRSLFASIFFYCIYCIRFFSPLQYYKQFYRYINNSKTEKKERADFHAFHTEVYLLVVFLIFLGNSFCPFLDINTLYAQIIFWLFLIESIFWMLYYMLFRILMERHLSIFNEAEYFLCLPVVIATQTIIIASLVNIEGFTAIHAFAAIFDLGDLEPSFSSFNHEVLLKFLGFLYTTIIIANLINLLPAIPVHRRQNITIIGAGDVVEKRMLNALLEIYKASQISIVSYEISSKFKKILDNKKIHHRCFHDIDKIMSYVKGRSSFAIIAVPTQYHYEYIIRLNKEGIPFAVEKPITHIGSYLEELKVNTNLMKNGFLLSYYWLEKALPLNYFLTLNPEYMHYLSIYEWKNVAEKQVLREDIVSKLQYCKLRLGKPKNITIKMIESDEESSRQWSLNKENGGVIFETFIHPMTLLCNLCPKYKEMNVDTLEFFAKSSPNEIHNTGMRIRGDIDDCKFFIEIDKDSNKKRERNLEILYEFGQINVDFEERSCLIQRNDGEKIMLQIKDNFSQKYEVQMMLVDSFIQNHCQWNVLRYDDFPNQIEILLFLFDKMYQKYLE